MAHSEQIDFVKNLKNKFQSYFQNKKVLEVGSLDINGSIRSFFDDCNYLGLDVSFGNGVDVICEGQKYNAPDDSFDVTCSAECFEHNPYWLETFQNMIRLCKDGGLVFFTCATDGRPEHGTTRTTPADSPLTVGMGWDYYRNLNERDFRDQIDFDSYFDSYEFYVEENHHDLFFWGIVDKNKSKKYKTTIVDCFRFFNEKELLELRYEILKEHVDKFIILEGTKTFSGNDWKPLAKSYIEEFGFPKDKFIFIEENLPGNDEAIENNAIDIEFRNQSGPSTDTHKNSLNARTRERLLLDSMCSVLSEFDDETVFFVSDCDEIINPEFIKTYSEFVLQHPNYLVKVPLVELQGRVDLRAYDANSELPIKTDNHFFVATKKHFERSTPTQLRYDISYPFELCYLQENQKRMEDCGWHFSWMGDSEYLKLKMKSFSHYSDYIESSLIKNMNSSEMDEYMNNWKPEIDGINPWGNSSVVLRQYDVGNLPQQIFKYKHLKEFFLGNELSSIPLIAVPIVNGFHWLQRLVDSIDYPVDELFIIDNNGRGELKKQLDDLVNQKHKFIDKITVSHLPHNIGCSAAWNLAIKCYMMSPYWIITNNDVAFTPGLLKEMVEKASNPNLGVIKAEEFQWDLFLIKDWVIQKCGLFDENFYPAYLEDCDYYIRLLNQNVEIGHLESKHLHGDEGYETSGSQTWRLDSSIADKLHSAHHKNFYYIAKKWGDNWRDSNWQYHPWRNPFNEENIPITYTTYDLNFCREKNLGF